MEPTTNPVAALADAAAKRVPPKFQDAFDRVVTAGKKVMYGDDKTHAMMEDLLSKGDPIEAVGKGVTTLMGLLSKESRNTIPQEVYGPASLALMAEALDYVSQSRKRPITNDDVKSATMSFGNSMLAAGGVDEKGFAGIAGKTQELMQDPKIAQLIAQQMGGQTNGA